MARLIGCTCSEMQLDLVGCDCEADRADPKLVSIWPKGYADSDGKTVRMAHNADFAREARKLFGYGATVYAVRDLRPAPVEPVSEEYARAMSKNDNS